MPTTESGALQLLLTLLITIAVVAAIVRFVHIPYTVALVLAGLALAVLPDAPRVQVTPGTILEVFLPILLFYGAYHLDVRELRVNLTPIALLAVPGVMITAALVGLALHLATGLGWIEALLFGTIVAATDPVAVLTIFGRTGAPHRLATIVTGESLFNDGTALVFFGAALGIATAQSIDVARTIEQFVLAVAGGLALGVCVGIVGTEILKRIDDALLETAITLILAYGGYVLAVQFGASGPLETVAAGIFLGTTAQTAFSPTTRIKAGATWEFLDFLANSLLFLLMGLSLRSIGAAALDHFGLDILWPLSVAILAVVLSRAVVAWLVNAVLTPLQRRLPRGWRTVLTWSGLRGAVALAAALSLPLDVAGRDLLLTLTFGVVLFTILGQGLTIGPLLVRLRIVRADGESQRELEGGLGRLHAIQAAAQEVAALRDAALVEEQMADGILADLTAERARVRAALDATAARDAHLDHQQRRALEEHLLHVKREAIRDAYDAGRISEPVLHALLREIDAAIEQTAHSSDPSELGPEQGDTATPQTFTDSAWQSSATADKDVPGDTEAEGS